MSGIVQVLHSGLLISILAGLFLLLNILDAHSTWLVMRPHYFEREKNPFARWVFKKLGIPRGIIIFKTALFAFLIPAGAYYGAWEPFTLNIVLSVANILFILVVAHNYRVYHRLKRMRSCWKSDV